MASVRLPSRARNDPRGGTVVGEHRSDGAGRAHESAGTDAVHPQPRLLAHQRRYGVPQATKILSRTEPLCILVVDQERVISRVGVTPC